jgi:hypothetical protein
MELGGNNPSARCRSKEELVSPIGRRTAHHSLQAQKRFQASEGGGVQTARDC